MSKSKDSFFNLLVDISVSSESNIDRLSTSLKVFVRKYFDNHDYSEPDNPNEIVLNCIMKSEAILYTTYELESQADTEEAKLELLYYKDLVMKTLVVITSLDFFVKVLKENNLFKDASELKEKVKTEFRLEAAKLKQDLESGEFLHQEQNESRIFKDVKPTEYRRLSSPKVNTPKKAAFELPQIALPCDEELLKSDEELLKEIKEKPFSPMADLQKKILNKSKKHEPKTDKDGNKILRTAMGWEIPTDFLENGLYSD